MPNTSVRFCFITILTTFCFFSCNCTKTIAKWESNYNKGTNYVQQDSIEQAWPYLRDAYILSKDSFNSKKKFRKSLIDFYSANVLLKKHDIIDSLKLTDAVLNLSKKMNSSELLDYSNEIGRFADSLYKSRQFSNAIKLYDKRKWVLCENNLSNTQEYAKTLYGLGMSYKRTRKNNIKAKTNFEQALDVVESFGPFDSLEANLLNEFGIIFWRAGHLEKASEYEKRAIQIFESLEDFKSDGFYLANYVLALIEKDKNNYLNAIDAFKEVQKIMIVQNHTNNNSYAQLLGEIALNYDRIGDYEKAIYYCNQALEVSEISKRTISLNLMNKGYFYQNTGQYTLAHETYDESIESMKVSHGEDSEKYAKLLNNIGKLYFEENKFKEALVYFKNALEINEKPEDEKWHDDYSYMLNDYAKTLIELGDNEQAISLMEKNLNNSIDDKDKPKDEEFYNLKYSLAMAYNLTGDYKSALPLIEESTTNLGKILGKDHIDYGNFLKTLSITYFGLGMKDEGISSLLESNGVFVNQINKIFQFSSEQEKAAFIKMITNTFNQMQSLAQSDAFTDSSLVIANLNNQLMLKGLLLNNSRDILSKLGEIDSLKFKIEDYKNDKNKLSKLLTKYNTANENQIDSLKSVVNQREAELVKFYSANFEGGISLNRNWEDVRTQLKEDEVAIEFAHFNNYKNNKPTGETSYIAYLFTKDELQPVVIPLFKEKELKVLLDKSSPNSLYTVRGSKGKSMKSTKGIYNLIWLPIETYLRNLSPKKKVYFALSGILNQIPMSALGTKEKPILSYQYDLYQMGSTHNLINEINRKYDGNILLIGGVNYDMKSEESQYSASKWDELPGTLKEVKFIENILSRKGKSVSVWESDYASEKQFKALSGQSPDLIHIATHGFFFENPEVSRSSVDDEVSNIYRSSKDPLLRSGLILSGANEAWENNNYYSDNEDGILTAMEIANLDLSNTSVVVLSACETGLGDINGSEGVYGLQRAFKMAGVHTLIMSLWQVPDKETAIFMETFYKNWTENNTIRAAFIETQRSLSKTYKDEPFKWAAFVLFE